MADGTAPDNFGGFPPVDIQQLDEVPVVSGRLPTKEETRNGMSLMYFDPLKVVDARPLNIKLPKVARIYSSRNGMNELIIVIQAVVIGSDSIVGFRYPNGGNGSAWYGQVNFLSDDEIDDMGSSPFVYVKDEINASKKDIWSAITRTPIAKKLAEKFNETDVFQSEWNPESQVHLNYQSEEERATGIVMNLYGNLYVHVDYDLDGFHFSQKILLFEDSDTNTAELHLVSGPYPKDFESQQTGWKNWLQDVKALSEQKE